MHTYLVCGYEVSSDRVIEGISEICNIQNLEATRNISLKKVNSLKNKIISLAAFHSWLNYDQSIWLNFYHDLDIYYLEYPNNCFFSINIKKNEIHYEQYATCNEEQFAHLFLDQIIPLYLSTQNFLVLHASGLVLEDRACLFCGQSGSGKSTLAAEALKITKFISDDFIQISFNDDKNDDKISALPSYASVRLWQENHSKNLHNKNLNDLKQRISIPEAQRQTTSLEIAKIFFLERDLAEAHGQFKLSNVKDIEFFKKVINNLFLLELDNKAKQAETLKKVSKLCSVVQGFNLNFSDLKDTNLSFLTTL